MKTILEPKLRNVGDILLASDSLLSVLQLHEDETILIEIFQLFKDLKFEIGKVQPVCLPPKSG